MCATLKKEFYWSVPEVRVELPNHGPESDKELRAGKGAGGHTPSWVCNGDGTRECVRKVKIGVPVEVDQIADLFRKSFYGARSGHVLAQILNAPRHALITSSEAT